MNINLFTDLCTAVSDSCKKAHQKYLSQQETQKQQEQNQWNREIMFALQKDLFEVLGNRHYHRLVQITHPACIRMQGWKKSPTKGILYLYGLDKELSLNASGRIPETLLSQIWNNMNLDIVQKQNELVSVFSPDVFYSNFPFLYCGMQIAGLKDIGTSVVLEVMTNVQP